ncbi:cyclin-dependent kinase 2-interacting protein-like isoform X1 [Periplaneta americana]|uniref:cyclin-dependent kinase 2-interacting protein-like isoform X1 n=1 Tax=Periplaneta americana TaxID=6978 RepID=UPI0037E745CC
MCSTPSNKSSTSPHFSPVTVKDSPVKKIHQCGNLTGNCRRLRDLAAELFNLIQEWNTQHLLGVQIVKSIMNLKHPVLIGCDMGSSTQTYPDGLQELCDELSEIVLIMERVVEKMEVIPRQMRSVATLEKLNSMNKAPLFLTWPSEKFGEVSEEILEAYKCELKIKNKVKRTIAHSTSIEALMYYTALWVHQTDVDSKIDLLVESLLLETGHR